MTPEEIYMHLVFYRELDILLVSVQKFYTVIKRNYKINSSKQHYTDVHRKYIFILILQVISPIVWAHAQVPLGYVTVAGKAYQQ